MMLRHRVSALALAVGSLLVLAGCASSPASAPSNEPTGDATSGEVAPVDDPQQLEATWLDDGRVVSVVTWGSSSCVPEVQDVTAEGQDITVTMADIDPSTACTADFAPRASVLGVPEGVDPTKDTTVNVTVDGNTFTTTLAGDAALTGSPTQPTDYSASAGWAANGIVLLTWGSSSCPPIVSDLTATDGGATVVFSSEDRACTRDMSPRATYLESEQLQKKPGFELTLEGDSLDGTVTVIGG